MVSSCSTSSKGNTFNRLGFVWPIFPPKKKMILPRKLTYPLKNAGETILLSLFRWHVNFRGGTWRWSIVNNLRDQVERIKLKKNKKGHTNPTIRTMKKKTRRRTQSLLISSGQMVHNISPTTRFPLQIAGVPFPGSQSRYRNWGKSEASHRDHHPHLHL